MSQSPAVVRENRHCFPVKGDRVRVWVYCRQVVFVPATGPLAPDCSAYGVWPVKDSGLASCGVTCLSVPTGDFGQNTRKKGAGVSHPCLFCFIFFLLRSSTPPENRCERCVQVEFQFCESLTFSKRINLFETN